MMESITTMQEHIHTVKKDKAGLNDFHSMPDPYGIDIDKVGISRFRIPLLFSHKTGQVMNHDAEASMYVQFPKGKAGINMSRLYEFLQEETTEQIVDHDMFKRILSRYQSSVSDADENDPCKAAFLKFDFNYCVKQSALVSERKGWQYYQCSLEGNINVKHQVRMFLTLHYEYSSTCPCSLSMSKQYESEHAQKLTDRGEGMAVAHSQRSQAICTVEIPFGSHFFVEDLLQILQKAIPTETQSFVKRKDEQAFAILNAQNPMFVEDAARRLSVALNKEKEIVDWVVLIDHLESLHSHNASAVISKGIPNGLS